METYEQRALSENPTGKISFLPEISISTSNNDVMVENLTISVSFSEVEKAHVSNYLRLFEMSGEFLIIQKPGNTFHFLCINNCDIVDIYQSLDWYVVSEDTFNDRLIIGIDLSDKESTNEELYWVQDETMLTLRHGILRFTFESDLVRQFFLYNTHFKGKMRINGALCFYIYDCYPTRCKDISASNRKTSNLVFRFKEGRQAAPVAKIFLLYIVRMPFFEEKVTDTVLIPIPTVTREYNLTRFTRSCGLFSRQFKVVDGFHTTWIKEDREQMRGAHGQDKSSNLIFYFDYFKGWDVFLVDDIISSGENLT